MKSIQIDRGGGCLARANLYRGGPLGVHRSSGGPRHHTNRLVVARVAAVVVVIGVALHGKIMDARPQCIIGDHVVPLTVRRHRGGSHLSSTRDDNGLLVAVFITVMDLKVVGHRGGTRPHSLPHPIAWLNNITLHGIFIGWG